jgi:hypothetical protein
MKRAAVFSIVLAACGGDVQNPGESLDDLDLCALKERGGCGYESCRAQAVTQRMEFHGIGCGAEYDRVTECTRADPCGSAPACREQRDRLNACEDETRDCIGLLPGDGECAITCSSPRFGAWCRQAPAGLVCSCLPEGSGIEFTDPGTCDEVSWIAAARATCR